MLQVLWTAHPLIYGRCVGFQIRLVSLLTDEKVRQAFDVVNADDSTANRYGRNLFGWTLLTAKRLIETGVTLVQANLGNYTARGQK